MGLPTLGHPSLAEDRKVLSVSRRSRYRGINNQVLEVRSSHRHWEKITKYLPARQPEERYCYSKATNPGFDAWIVLCVMTRVLVGTCGFALSQKQYFRTFPIIEIQQTFYFPPTRETAHRWRHAAPEEFVFTLKAFQAITHSGDSPTYRRARLSAADRQQCGNFQDSPVVRRAWAQTLQIARVLKAPLVVFQCPARFTPSDTNLANLRRFFGWAERDSCLFGFEPRGASWDETTVREICRECQLIHVVDPLEQRPVWGNTRYYRLHGNGNVSPPIGYRHCYSDEELRRILNFCDLDACYCLFNNVSMKDDALRFERILAEKHPPKG